MTELKAFLGTCISEEELAGLDPVFDLIEANLCLQEDSQWCLPSLLALIPMTELLFNGYSPDMRFTQNLDSEDHLDLVCRTDGCMRKISESVVVLLQEHVDAPPNVLEIATKAGTTCMNEAVRTCRVDFSQNFLTENEPDPDKACEDGHMKKCFQYVAPQLGFEDPCSAEGDVDDPLRTLVEGVFAVPDIAVAFFEENQDNITKYLVEDLKLNLPGLVGDNLSLNVTVVEDGDDFSLLVSFIIAGTLRFEQEFNVGEAVEALKGLWGEGQSFFPNTNVMAMGLMTSQKLVAPVMQQVVVVDMTTTPNPQDGTGSSSSASLSMSLFASAGAVFLAVLLAM